MPTDAMIGPSAPCDPRGRASRIGTYECSTSVGMWASGWEGAPVADEMFVVGRRDEARSVSRVPSGYMCGALAVPLTYGAWRSRCQ
jgi:hypothetical protein